MSFGSTPPEQQPRVDLAKHGSVPPAYPADATPEFVPSAGFGPTPYAAAWGQAAPYDPYAVPAPTGRPSVVTTAAIVSIVSSGLGVLAFLISLIGLFAVRSDFLNELESASDTESAFGDVVVVFAFIVVGIGLFWSICGVVLGVMVLKPSSIARVGLTVSAVFAALLSLLAIGSLVSAVPLIAAVATIVLLYLPESNRFFDTPRY